MICFACNSQIPQANCCRGSNSNKYKFFCCFQNFSLFFKDLLKGKELFYVTGDWKYPCYAIWQGNLPPVVFAPKGIKFLFAMYKRVLATAGKLQKNPRKFKCIACGTPLPFGSLMKGLSVLLQKVICYPLDYFACGIHELHATQIMFCHTAEGT